MVGRRPVHWPSCYTAEQVYETRAASCVLLCLKSSRRKFWARHIQFLMSKPALFKQMKQRIKSISQSAKHSAGTGALATQQRARAPVCLLKLTTQIRVPSRNRSSPISSNRGWTNKRADFLASFAQMQQRMQLQPTAQTQRTESRDTRPVSHATDKTTPIPNGKGCKKA